MPGSLSLPEGMYGIYAELGVYLVEESGAKVPADTLVGRLEKHIEREVESLTAGEFLARIQGVAAQAGMKHVIGVEKDDVTIYAFGPGERGGLGRGIQGGSGRCERFRRDGQLVGSHVGLERGVQIQTGCHIQEEAHPRKPFDDAGGQGAAGGVGQAAG